MSVEIARLADRLALRALVDEYAFAADHRDPERFAAVFAPDGALVARTADGARTLAEHRGSDALRAVVTDVLPRFGTTFHVVANHGCTLDGDAATGETYCVAHHLTEGDGRVRDRVMLIRYEDRYARLGEGWRIAERIAVTLWDEYTV